jgi:uncharacterized protein (DUF427 family)
MGLTYGEDPFGPQASGRFSFDSPDGVLFARPLGRRVPATVGSVVRIDRVRVTAGGAVIAESTRTKALHETGLPVRHCFPSADVRLDLFESSPTVTECPYKGTASYLGTSVDGQQVDVAWTYTGELRREGEPVRDLIAFLDDVVDVQVVDGTTRSDGDR